MPESPDQTQGKGPVGETRTASQEVARIMGPVVYGRARPLMKAKALFFAKDSQPRPEGSVGVMERWKKV